MFNLNNRSEIVADRIVVRANVATGSTGLASAALLEGGAALTCTCCDFGTDAEDNAPIDLLMAGVQLVPIDDVPFDFVYTTPDR